MSSESNDSSLKLITFLSLALTLMDLCVMFTNVLMICLLNRQRNINNNEIETQLMNSKNERTNSQKGENAFTEPLYD